MSFQSLESLRKGMTQKKKKNLGSNSFMVYGTLEKECLKYLENKYISYSHYWIYIVDRFKAHYL